MDKIENYRQIVTKILQKYADLPYSYGDIKSSLIISKDHNQFLIIDEGWQDGIRVYGVLVHVEMRNNKIWIQRDGIEAGITNDEIVLAFHPPELRQYTDYAIA